MHEPSSSVFSLHLILISQFGKKQSMSFANLSNLGEIVPTHFLRCNCKLHL